MYLSFFKGGAYRLHLVHVVLSLNILIMELEGIVQDIGASQTVGKNGFVKRALIVKTESAYPQVLCVEFTMDRTILLDPLQTGDLVKVSINIKGNIWQSPEGMTKYFTVLEGWRLQVLNSATTPLVVPTEPDDKDFPF